MTTATRSRAVRLLLAALVTAIAVGCSTTPNIDEGNDMDELTELQRRASSEDIVASYTTMGTAIRAAITTVAATTWVARDEQSESGCGQPFSGLGARTVVLGNWSSDTPIPDDEWPSALTAAQAIATTYGFTDNVTKVDEPGNHQVRFLDPALGAYVDIGSKVAAVYLNSTGCHLPGDSNPTG